MRDEIKKNIEEFFLKMTANIVSLEVKILNDGEDKDNILLENNRREEKNNLPENQEIIEVNVKIKEPQVFIGQNGQTLFDIQHLLAKVLSKTLKKNVFLELDINNYKRKKIEYLKNLAREVADEVALTKKEKELIPMPPYERRIIHLELSQRSDIFTESRGEENNRRVVIKPKQFISE